MTKKKNQKLQNLKCSLNSLIKLLPEKKNKKFKDLIIESQKNKSNNIIAEIKEIQPQCWRINKRLSFQKILLINMKNLGRWCNFNFN